MLRTGRDTFCFLILNLLLAFVPYIISYCLTNRAAGRPGLWRRLTLAAGCLAWLLCIPNAFYITTDLFHLTDWYNDHKIPTWYDLVMILSFAWNGFFLGVLSVRQMERLLRPHLPAHNELLFLYPLFWLNALGVYIGRYLRYNSWDVIADPFRLFRDIASILMHPLRNDYAWGMIFCFSILMTLMYLMLRKISRALA
ncbi:MAG: DUF1361 domain-containing protein [Bacteroidota bacterium]|nr:DUF1361 domain-containing protein [Bacteroidota bacterium]MDP4214850.1 DUF1361 domain-containing protein [Bacteroidota bacterium]MDP4252960.1 DUF1361 domain-containing protein [Bacteroidota bacterium]MDP4259048.1 DUF1361 domain-containing protein [Bacteroidota bacterium]